MKSGSLSSKLAQAFNVSLEKLMLGEEKPSPESPEHLLAAKESIEVVKKSVKTLQESEIALNHGAAHMSRVIKFYKRKIGTQTKRRMKMKKNL